ASMLTQLRTGALEFQTISNGALAELVPVAGVTFVPFAFDGFKQAWSAVDGALGSYIRTAIQRANLYVFEKQFDIGFRQLANQVRPINRPDDIKGLKIRITQAPVP